MSSHSLLIFDLDHSRYAIHTFAVRESVWLPELAVAEEAPPWIIGLFSLRNQIVPVADLQQRFGRPARRCLTSDQVIVLEIDSRILGLVVSEMICVTELDDGALQPSPLLLTTGNESTLIAGEFRLDEDLVTLLDASLLVRNSGTAPPPLAQPTSDRYFCAGADMDEREIFHRRALALCAASATETGPRLGIAIVELGGEHFGIDLAAIREFCVIAQCTPIPCCPPHILGTISLRGDLLNVLDLRSALNLLPNGQVDKAMIASLAGHPVAIALDEVLDVAYLPQEDVRSPPPALRDRFGAEITGTTTLDGHTISILNLPALLARQEWVVDESIGYGMELPSSRAT